MFITAKISCPSCQGSRCRESRWLSIDEKRGHPDGSPYRCLDCSHRFLARKASFFERDTVVSASWAIFAIVLTAIVTFWWARTGSSSVAPSVAMSTVIDPALLKAAETGDAGAQFKVGEALFNDPAHSNETSAKAVRWLRLAAENGNAEAMVLLGRLSRSGVGILQDFGQSAKWIQTAATRGDSEGMLELGRLYRDGVGVEKDMMQAYIWFNRAAAAHNLDAVREREVVVRQLAPEELKEAQARSSAVDASRIVSPVGSVRK